MANGDQDPTTPDPEDSGPQQGPQPGPPSAPPQAGPPQGGGPMLAALMRRAQQPPVSAPGPGNVGNGLMMLKNAVDMLQQALPSLPAGSQQHKDVLKALQSLSKHLPQGAPTAGVQQTQIGDMLRATMRNAILQRIAANRGGGGAPGGPPGGAPQAPTPSMPLPGA